MHRLKTYFLILLGVLIAFPAMAQLKRANRKFDNLSYARAIRLYHKALEDEPTSLEIMTQLADSYRLINDSKQAEYWYSKVVKNSRSEPINMFYYGQALMNNKKWDTAAKWFEKYLQAKPGDQLGTAMLKSSENYERFLRDSTLYNVVITNINTKDADWGPAIVGNKIMFSSARRDSEFLFGWTGRSFLELYTAEYNGSANLGEVERLHGKINSKFHEGGTTTSKNGQIMYFSRNNIIRGKVGSSEEGVVRLKTFRAEWNGKRWRKLEGIPFNSDEYSVGHPTLSRDGKILYFVSDMPGGEGGTDLYMATVNIEDNTFGKAVNLGPNVNTPGDEMFPWIDPYGTLYFASDGHEGLGGLDIFVGKAWNTSEPDIKNIGYPINSSQDDFALVMDTRRGIGFFSSNRNGGVGDDDIYSFSRKQVFRGIVVDAQTGEPIENARVELYDVNQFQGLGRTDANGIMQQGIVPNRQYKVVASKEGYAEKTEYVSAQGISIDKDVVLRVELDKAGCGEVFTLDGIVKNIDGDLLPGTRVKLITKETILVADENGELDSELMPNTDYTVVIDDPAHMDKVYNVTTKGKDPNVPVPLEIILGKPNLGNVFYIIYYNFDKHNIRPGDARPELDRVVNYMKANPSLKVLLTSHTDCRASNAYNQTLSKNRAIEAFTYITEHGINKDRLRYEWKGETVLTNGCRDGVECSEEEHQLNRRTEFSFDGYTGGQ